eukprot:508528-Prorocentrum_minimum.AAC.3
MQYATRPCAVDANGKKVVCKALDKAFPGHRVILTFWTRNAGTLFAFEFAMMHYVEVRRWQDYKKFGSVNTDPFFPNNSVPNTEMGYPGGIFDPFGFAKGDMKELQTKEIKNGRLAMVAFVGFTIQAQALGEGPVASLKEHLANPFGSNILTNLGQCVLPDSVNAGGVIIPTPCLWP